MNFILFLCSLECCFFVYLEIFLFKKKYLFLFGLLISFKILSNVDFLYLEGFMIEINLFFLILMFILFRVVVFIFFV